MSATVSQSDKEALNDPEEWQSLSSDEQQRILQSGLEEHIGGPSGSMSTVEDNRSESWSETSSETKDKTLQAIEESLEDTWTGKAFEGIDTKKTIPVELSPLTDDQQEVVQNKVQLLMKVESMNVESWDIESLDDDNIDEVVEEHGEEAGEMLGKLNELQDWLPGFLADISAEPDFDTQWWTGTDFPSGFKMEVFYIIVERYADEMRQIQSFRS